MEPEGPGLGREIFLPLAGPHRDRRLHSRQGARQRRILHEVPRGQLQGLGAQHAPLQLVQQSALPLLGQEHPQGDHGPRRQDQQLALVRRLPRPGDLLLGQLRRSGFRRSDLRDRNRRLGPGGHHLHGLPRHHQRQQRARQRRLHHRRAQPLSLRLQRKPDPSVGQPAAGEGQARVPQKNLPQAAAQNARLLRQLPQGAPAARAQRLQMAARPEPLRQLPPFGRFRPFRQRLLLPAQGGSELQRLPHAVPAFRAVRGQRFRRQGRPRDPFPPVPERQHRDPAAGRPDGGLRCRPGRQDQRRAPQVQRRRGAGRHLRAQGRRLDRRAADRAAAAGRCPPSSRASPTCSTWWCAR